jgi:hypothetical protein
MIGVVTFITYLFHVENKLLIVESGYIQLWSGSGPGTSFSGKVTSMVTFMYSRRGIYNHAESITNEPFAVFFPM